MTVVQRLCIGCNNIIKMGNKYQKTVVQLAKKPNVFPKTKSG